jgi:hypothetical protein
VLLGSVQLACSVRPVELLTFRPGLAAAVRCSVDVQERLYGWERCSGQYPLAVGVGLEGVEVCVEAVLCEEFWVAADFGQVAVVEDEDEVGGADGGEAV